MDFSFFEKLNQRRFRKMTQVGRKPRRLVIHPSFKSFLSRIVDNNTLGRHFEKIHVFDENFEFTVNTCYAFMIPPIIPVIQRIATCRAQVPEKLNPYIELWFQPRVNDLVCAFMVEAGIAPASILEKFPSEKISAASQGSIAKDGIEVYNLEMDVVPLDNDVLTMYSPHAFFRFAYQHDFTVVDEVRYALDIIASSGGFLSITGIGNLAVAVAKTLPPANDSYNTHLIIIDRSTDLITPLLTQMNYEGLVCEFFGIDCGTVAVPSEQGNKLQLFSSTSDKVFETLRSMTHQEASDEIERRTNQITGAFQTRDTPRSLQDNLQAFRKAASTSLENQTLIDHVNLAQRLFSLMKENKFFKPVMNLEANMLLLGPNKAKETIQDMLEYGTDLRQVIRVICLDSLLRGGSSEFAKYVNSLNFNYGVQMVPFLLRLQEIGLFTQSGPKWGNFIKTFQLNVLDWDQTDDQAAASYLGYAPLSIRYVQRVVAGDVGSITRALQDIGHKTFESGQTEVKVDGNFLVCFIGGCTHSELNSLRRVGKSQKLNYHVVTTDLFGSGSFFDNLAVGIPGYDPVISV